MWRRGAGDADRTVLRGSVPTGRGWCSRASTSAPTCRSPRAGRWRCIWCRTGRWPDLAGLTGAERDELAELYPDCWAASTRSTAAPLPTSPPGTRPPWIRRCAESGYLHLQLTSPRRAADKLKYLAGSEAAMGAFINDTLPNRSPRRCARRPGTAVPDGTCADAPIAVAGTATRRPRRHRGSLRLSVRPRARGRVGGTRTGEPDRRAHRLQRRLCAAVCHRPHNHGGARRPRRPHRSACLRVGPGPSPWKSIWTACDRAARPAGRRIRWAWPGRWSRAGMRCPDSTCWWTPTCRSAPGCRPPPRWNAPSRWPWQPSSPERGPGRRAGQADAGRRRTPRRERHRRRPHRHHGPVRVAVWRGRIAPSSWTAATKRSQLVPLGWTAPGWSAWSSTPRFRTPMPPAATPAAAPPATRAAGSWASPPLRDVPPPTAARPRACSTT